jgi:hypothetical protein
MLPLAALFAEVGLVDDMASAMALGLLTILVPKELALVFRDNIGSGNSKFGGQVSSSRERRGSGDAWIEELVVRTAVSGDMMGEPCCELEAREEELIADVGKAAGLCGWKFV